MSGKSSGKLSLATRALLVGLLLLFIPVNIHGRPTSNIRSGKDLIRLAERFIGTPYRFGGTSPRTGFDCSGYVQYIYRYAGVRTPRSAAQMYKKLKPVVVPRVGDLVFFRVNGRRISHVGIYAGNFRFLHAPQTGKRVSYANIRSKYWKKRYAGARTAFR